MGRQRRPVQQDSSKSPCRCCQACWKRVVSSTTSRATALLSQASRVAMSATGHRPIPRPGTVHRPAARQVDDQGRPVGFRSSIKIRKAGGRGPWPSPGLFDACHRRPLRADPQGRVRPHREHDRCAHGVDIHPLDPQASPTRLIISALNAAVDCLPLPVLGMDFLGSSELINHGVVK